MVNADVGIPISWILTLGIMIPFLGTTLGAACVLFIKGEMNAKVRRALNGFAAGVMVAASVWSLLIPSLEQADGLGGWSFVPAVTGFWIGMLFPLLNDMIQKMDTYKAGSVKTKRKSTTMLVLAVTLHNIPEGMAVGAVYAGFLSGNAGISAAAALTLSMGIAVQNFPEGAIISMPLRSDGAGRKKAFLCGMASGAVEPAGAIVTVLAAGIIIPVLPYLLSFAAGAMFYVVVEELIPETAGKTGKGKYIGLFSFAAGFSVMMALDVVFG